MIRSVVVSLLLLAVGTVVEAQERKLEDYFPVTPGSKWHYQTTTTLVSVKDFKTEAPLVLEIDKVEQTKEGTKVWIISDPASAGEIVLINERGLFRTNAG